MGKKIGFNLLIITGNCALYFILMKIKFQNYKAIMNATLFILNFVPLKFYFSPLKPPLIEAEVNRK